MDDITDFCNEPLSIKAHGTVEKPEPPKDQKISIPGHMIPDGAKLVECYMTGREVIICGDTDDENHNCDLMGCSSMSHVIHRFDLNDSRERKYSND